MDTTKLKPCPWKRTRMSPSLRGMESVLEYIDARGVESILEIGAGYSTWYLHQLNFDNYTSVETYQSTIDQIESQNFDHHTLVRKWEDIPVFKYKWFFLDSHVGGEANKYDRFKSLAYSLDHSLLKDEAIIFVHDYKKIKMCNGGNNTSKWCRNYMGWFAFEKKYGLRFMQTLNDTEFGVYCVP